jgi:G:T-mismatch repair DNA endonuclease (very short patch repair protein)
VYQETLDKDEIVYQHFENEEHEIQIVWECEADHDIMHDEDMKKFNAEMSDTGPFDPRACLLGGLIFLLENYSFR